jgi:hypothetical protein
MTTTELADDEAARAAVLQVIRDLKKNSGTRMSGQLRSMKAIGPCGEPPHRGGSLFGFATAHAASKADLLGRIS